MMLIIGRLTWAGASQDLSWFQIVSIHHYSMCGHHYSITTCSDLWQSSGLDTLLVPYSSKLQAFLTPVNEPRYTGVKMNIWVHQQNEDHMHESTTPIIQLSLFLCLPLELHDVELESEMFKSAAKMQTAGPYYHDLGLLMLYFGTSDQVQHGELYPRTKHSSWERCSPEIRRSESLVVISLQEEVQREGRVLPWGLTGRCGGIYEVYDKRL